jgi:hypothetical protein
MAIVNMNIAISILTIALIFKMNIAISKMTMGYIQSDY